MPSQPLKGKPFRSHARSRLVARPHFGGEGHPSWRTQRRLRPSWDASTRSARPNLPSGKPGRKDQVGRLCVPIHLAPRHGDPGPRPTSVGQRTWIIQIRHLVRLRPFLPSSQDRSVAARERTSVRSPTVIGMLLRCQRVRFRPFPEASRVHPSAQRHIGFGRYGCRWFPAAVRGAHAPTRCPAATSVALEYRVRT